MENTKALKKFPKTPGTALRSSTFLLSILPFIKRTLRSLAFLPRALALPRAALVLLTLAGRLARASHLLKETNNLTNFLKKKKNLETLTNFNKKLLKSTLSLVP